MIVWTEPIARLPTYPYPRRNQVQMQFDAMYISMDVPLEQHASYVITENAVVLK